MFCIPQLLKVSVLITISANLQACVMLVPFIEKDSQAERASIVKDSCSYSKFSTEKSTQDNTSQVFSLHAEPIAMPAEVRAMPATMKVVSTRPRRRRAYRPTVSEKVSILISQLSANNDVTRTHAASDLGFIGTRARTAVPALAQALAHDPSKWVRRAAAKSIGKIGAREGIRALELALNDRNEWVVHSAKNALKRLRRS